MQKQTIYGIDIYEGSPQGRELPRYALAILKDGKVSHQIMLSRQKIFNMIQRDKPEIIAVDNILELAADRSELIYLMERLPESIKLVQVTGGLHLNRLLRLRGNTGFLLILKILMMRLKHVLVLQTLELDMNYLSLKISQKSR
jgi:predicted RNase H-like nuclease (RuvC/YqgF family)